MRLSYPTPSMTMCNSCNKPSAILLRTCARCLSPWHLLGLKLSVPWVMMHRSLCFRTVRSVYITISNKCLLRSRIHQSMRFAKSWLPLLRLQLDQNVICLNQNRKAAAKSRCTHRFFPMKILLRFAMFAVRASSRCLFQFFSQLSLGQKECESRWSV
ncbi:hypothetical protein D3C76_523530 [compost metagenome]